MNRVRPLLFLDVDGPLNPYAAKPEKRPDGYTTIRVPQDSGTPDEHRGLSARWRPLRVWHSNAAGCRYLLPGHSPGRPRNPSASPTP